MQDVTGFCLDSVYLCLLPPIYAAMFMLGCIGTHCPNAPHATGVVSHFTPYSNNNNHSSLKHLQTFFLLFFQIMEEDLISTWTCFICKIPPTFEQAQYMWNQFLVNEKRMFVDDGLDISFKCIFCGTLFHARCLIDVQQLSPGDIPNIATDAWMCSACSFRP